MTPTPLLLSVLDLAPVGTGSSPAEALRNSIELVRLAEKLGYTRYWVAEHHNMPGIASSSPAVLLAHAAAATESIRVGSGGVMLPNHASLTVAEQFGMLEALHPGRIDLGLGRAPGTDPLTAQALRRRYHPETEDDFPDQLIELFGYFTGRFPEGHPYRAITAVPALGYQPAIWLLGSSDYSAHVAGLLGLPFSFAHHFAPRNTLPAIEVYRKAFRPSDVLSEPYVMVGVSVVSAETAERADWIAGPGRLAFVRLRRGRPGRYPTPEEAAAYEFTPFERELIGKMGRSTIVGTPDHVQAELTALASRTGADELMITTMTHGHHDRMTSYRLVAETFDLAAQTHDDPERGGAAEAVAG